LNIFTKITKIDVTVNKRAIIGQVNIRTTYSCATKLICVNHTKYDGSVSRETEGAQAVRSI
jgi:hypothetical protein